MEGDIPKVGRIVHFVDSDARDAHRAAIITETSDPRGGLTGLCIFRPAEVIFRSDVRYDDGMAAGTWHWPERA
jgi:hypothetical protein